MYFVFIIYDNKYPENIKNKTPISIITLAEVMDLEAISEKERSSTINIELLSKYATKLLDICGMLFV